jgi:GT2 family glycosyltransferase
MKRDSDQSPDKTSVSIIVATFNRAKALQRALTSLKEMELGPSTRLEIVVVDNMSTDDTGEVVSQFAGEVHGVVRRVVEERPGVCYARNLGIREAKGEWIAFFDDDQLADPRWLMSLLEFAKARGVKCVGGSVQLTYEAGCPSDLEMTSLLRRLLGEKTGNTSRRYSSRYLPGTGNALIHRDVFQKIDQFDEKCLQGGSDTLFFSQVLSAGFEAWFTPDAIVHHVIPAHRVKREFFTRTSLRRGVTMGRRDFDEFGRLRLVSGLFARTMHAMAVLAPRYLCAMALRQKSRAFENVCRLKKLEGYARFAISHLAPRGLGQQQVLSALHHRESVSAQS